MNDENRPVDLKINIQSNRLVLVLIFALVFLMAARTPLDTDLWWHLRAGDNTLQTGLPMLTDTLSFTRAGTQWINHSWLSEVGMALVFRAGGYLGLSLVVALLAAISMVILYYQMSGPALLRAFIILLATLVAAVVWSPRPQILSLVLLAICSMILDAYRRKGINRLWLLPPIFVLWSNLHGGYPLGLMLIGAVMAGEIIDAWFEPSENRPAYWKRVRTLLPVMIGCGLAVIINPNGVSMWKIPFQTVGIGILQDAIPEWASPDFHDFIQQPFLWLFLLVIAAFATTRRHVDGADWIAILLFGAGGLMARRNFGPFAIIAAPILSRYLCEAITALRGVHSKKSQSLAEGRFNRPISPHVQKGINLLLMGFIGFIAVVKLYVVSQPQFVQAYEHTVFPVDSVNWLRETSQESGPFKGNLFNSYAWGGYLTWAYPEKPVFVDGRTDLYGDEIISEWLTVVQGNEGWQGILDRWEIGLVMVEPDRPVVSLLGANGWTLIHEDRIAVIYQKDSGE